MQRAVEQVVQEGTQRTMQVRFLSALVAVIADQLGSAIQALAFREMSRGIARRALLAADGPGEQTAFGCRAQCVADIAHAAAPVMRPSIGRFGRAATRNI